MRKLWEQRNIKEKIIFNFSLVNQRNHEKGYKDTFEDFSVLPYSTDNRNLILIKIRELPSEIRSKKKLPKHNFLRPYTELWNIFSVNDISDL